MRTVAIANPVAAAGRVRKDWPAHERILEACFGSIDTRFTQAPGDATRLAADAARDGAECVVAVGGDGTINEVVNGLMRHQGASRPRLAVYPAGTGGDFARSIGLSGVELARALRDVEVRRCDVGRATVTGSGGQHSRYFINAASLGATALVVRKVNDASKRLGGRLSFIIGTVKGLAAYRNTRLRIRVDDSFEEELLLNSVVVANGRYFGGGMMIAPNASLDDGAFEVVLLGDIGVGTFARHSGKLYAGTHLTLPEVRCVRGRRVTVQTVGSDEPWAEVDGELLARGESSFEIVPGALEVVVTTSASAWASRRAQL